MRRLRNVPGWVVLRRLEAPLLTEEVDGAPDQEYVDRFPEKVAGGGDDAVESGWDGLKGKLEIK